MSEKCLECDLDIHDPLPCLHNLNNICKRLESQITTYSQTLKYYQENSCSLNTIESAYDHFKFIEHIHACCDGCYELPLIGTRYKCKKCPNFDLCFKCRHTFPHKHANFFPITTSKYHINKQCNSCFGKIADIVYKCIVCGKDLCHECLLVNGHEHDRDRILSLMPFDTDLEWSSNKNLKRLRKGDEVNIKLVILNNSLQHIGKVVVVAENCPFEVPRIEIDLNLKYGKIGVIDLFGNISAESRHYDSKFEIVDTFWECAICPPISIKMVVTEGLFSSFFRS